MSIFKDLLFLHGQLHDTRYADRPRSYATGYGNAVASREAFAPLRGQAVRRDRHVAAVPAAAACGCR